MVDERGYVGCEIGKVFGSDDDEVVWLRGIIVVMFFIFGVLDCVCWLVRFCMFCGGYVIYCE